MQDFESYAARERLASLLANTARKLTRQQRARCSPETGHIIQSQIDLLNHLHLLCIH